MTEAVKEKWPPYHWLESPEIQPTVDEFWRAKFEDRDLSMYNRFIEILRLSKGGLSGESIGKSLGINNVRKYITGNKMSFLTHLRAERDRLGPPRSRHKWLPRRLKPRGTPDKDWVEVPTYPICFADVQSLIERLTPAPVELEVLTRFGFHSVADIESERTNLFGFLLGAVVGDSGKNHKGNTRFNSMNLSLVLSKNKQNSFRFGEFFSLCGNVALGLKVHRVNDPPISESRFGKTECYCWLSPSSPLCSWLFNECLGLKDTETTTYHPLRMEWLLSAPRDFKIHFVQGLGESDGWPSAGDDDVKLVSSPNTELFAMLLEDLGCHPHRIRQPLVELLRCATEEAWELPFFSPRIASNLYLELNILATAKRHPERIRLPQQTIDTILELSKSESSTKEICLKLAAQTGFKVSGSTVRKYETR